MLNFELTRSRFRDITGTTLWEGADLNKPYRFGLQLTELTRRPEESEKGTTSGRHYVVFSFTASANIFSRQHSDRVETTAQVSTLFTLLLSVLAFFRFAKTQVEDLTDNAIMYLADKKKFPVPKDVQHRVRVLEERLKDPLGTAAAAAGGAHGSQRRQSRRLSRLLSHDAELAAARGGEIEMVSMQNPMARDTELPDEGGNDGNGKTRPNATVKQLQAEMRLLKAQQREEAARQRQEMAQQREEAARQRQEIARQREEAARQQQEMAQQQQQIAHLMAIVESTTVYSGAGAVEDDTSSLPEGWKALKTEDGRTYYEKPDRTTTWDPP
jgi:hypothetical protein